MKPSIDISDSVVLDVGIDRAWELVTDPQTVVACVPGAEIVSIDEDGTINGALSLSLGPSTTRFEGRILPTFDAVERSGRLEGQGGDGRGRTKAAITTSFQLTPVDDDHTTMAIDSSITVRGALAQFAMTGGQPVARRLLQDFAENIAALGAPAVDGDADRVPAVTKPLSGFGLLWRTFVDAVRRLFRKNPPPPTGDLR